MYIDYKKKVIPRFLDAAEIKFKKSAFFSINSNSTELIQF